MAVLIGLNQVLAELTILAGVLIVIFITFRVGHFLLKIVFGLISNSILGLLSLFLVNTFFGIGIPIAIRTLVPTIIFGLPAVGTIILMKLLGVNF